VLWCSLFTIPAWIPLAAVYKITWSAVEKEEGISTLPLMYLLMPHATAALAAFVVLVDPPGVTSFDFNVYSVGMLVLSGIGAFLVNWSGFAVLGSCSPLTHIILGQAKSSIVMVVGFLLLGYNPGMDSLLGAIIAILAMIAYTYVNLQEAEAAKSSLKTSPSLKPVTTS
jgi:hypothetical protein